MANAVLIASVSSSRSQEMNIEMPIIKGGEILGGPDGNGVIPCSLKRKRPPKIEIPNVLREISADIFKGRAAAQGQGDAAECFSDSGVGVCSLKGKKKFMEDSHKIFSSANGIKGFFGVYDGHGGSKAAEFVSENLHLKILEMLENSSEIRAKEDAVKEGYLKTDEEFLKQGLGSGVCCVTALIEGREMIISNLGDCRAVLSRDGIAEALTTDHRPTREDERRRIEDKGGYVEIHRGTWRVHGTLAVSRSIGDSHLKEWVMAVPDTRVINLSPDMEYLVLASDGLWEEVSNQEAVDIVMQSCGKKQLVRSSPAKEDSTLLSPFSKSPLLTPRKTFQTTGAKMSISQHKRSEDEQHRCETGSPPSKSRRLSMVKQMKVRKPHNNDENQILVEKSSPYGGGLVAACNELVNLAVTRGSLDDITVMIVDLNRYKV